MNTTPARVAISLSIAALLTLAGCGASKDAKGGPDRGTPQVRPPKQRSPGRGYGTAGDIIDTIDVIDI